MDSLLYNNAPLENASASSVAMTLLFSTIFFTTISLGVKSWLAGDIRAIQAAMNTRSSPLDLKSFSSIFTLLYHWSVFGGILFIAYICENHPPHPHGEKSYDRDEFFFMTAVLFLASAYTITKNDKNTPKKDTGPMQGHHGQAVEQSSVNLNGSQRRGRQTLVSNSVTSVKDANDVLNRDQTEEWKGWMQFMFLLYHYYHAEEVYNTIRIMITCYVWMTGFGNFSFFYLKGDYSLVRVLQMLWRLNFLVTFLCLTQGTTYILYYICPLHTYFFFMVYAVMRIGKDLNYSKYGLRLKLGALAIFIFLFWDVDTGIFRILHSPFLGETPQLGATGGSMWEWYFRTTLDHWSTFLGMIFAANFPITSLFYRKLEAQPLVLHFLAKASVGLGLLGAFYLWVNGPLMQPKVEYNQTNAYFGFIPLITYIYFRNITPKVRSYSLELLHQIGKSTLETYLMQHHIWLTSNAKSLLVLIPGWHKCNTLVVTVLYFYISRRLYKLTLFLRGMHLPNDLTKCVQSLAGIGLVIVIFYAIALSLSSMGLASLTPVAIVSIPCGFLLYQTILDSTWSIFRESYNPVNIGDQSFFESLFNSQNTPGSHNSSMNKRTASEGAMIIQRDTQVSRLTPPLIGAMVILILGTFWNDLAVSGAGKIAPLPATCGTYANQGAWIPVNPCNEDQKGSVLRDYDISSMVCTDPSNDAHSISGSFVWGWNVTAPNSLCRFSHRDTKTINNQLRGRTIAYVGDSMTRNLFFASLRAMGVPNVGGYDATIPKHSDIKQVVDQTITMEFRWAPLAQDQLDVIKDYNIQKPVDIIITGGGAWDRLHVWATDEDQASHKNTVKDLAAEIAGSVKKGVPVVWVVPTTINNPALNHEDKRDHMKEEHLEEMREFYGSLGILKYSSFVLDGTAFTHDRVLESYDGVHYPPQVYGAGAQILFNSFDWLLDPNDAIPKKITRNEPGKMANMFLGLMMLCISFIGLFFFDGFLGFSYLASFFVKGVMPNDLYEEAFSSLHKKNGLPAIEMKTRGRNTTDVDNNDDDFESLLNEGKA